MDRKELTDLIKEKSKNLGFNLVGITTPHKIENNFLDNWIDEGYHATMYWMESRLEERENIFKYFPEVKSVISLGYNYYTDQNNLDNSDYKISNYAWGEDYHLVLKKKLYLLLNIIKDKYPDLKYRVCVDTSPVSEKYWAQKAGLGAIGKHTNLINNKIGSWFFISEILIDEELNYDKAFVNDLCGTCTKCIDACPTDALVAPYQLDAKKCISYLTIELKDEISEVFKNKMDNWAFGCDICQDVCPWNRFSKNNSEPEFNPKEEIISMTKNDWLEITDEVFNTISKNSAIKRTKLKGLKRNIDFINS